VERDLELDRDLVQAARVLHAEILRAAQKS
jgi:hypothetical protein